MTEYEEDALHEVKVWQKQMLRRPSFLGKITTKAQHKINDLIPEKIHKALTVAIKQMVRAVLFGAVHTTAEPMPGVPLQVREAAVSEQIKFYKKTAAVEGGVTGAGGILLGLADFPILLSLKLKLLFNLATLYGFDVKNYKERLYMLFIFQLAFSSRKHRREVYLKLADWKEQSKNLPEDIHGFDWRTFQQEYRDYIDLAKMAQLIPVIGAAVGFIANYQLIKKLGVTAMNAYRMRHEILYPLLK